MKKVILLGAALCTLGLLTACKNGKQPVEVSQNGIVWEDVQISQAEFEAAESVCHQYQMERFERTPDNKDSSIVREWANEIGFSFEECMEECGFYRFEDGGDIIEMGMGDYGFTRTRNDTTRIEACWMSMSKDSLLAGWSSDAIYWDSPYNEAVGYVYIYPYDFKLDKLGKQYIFNTHPRWFPCGDSFWGADGWFFIHGWNKEGNNEYHKIRPKME
ncbi:MAG: hypothetical protein K5864_01575 [Bacteroidales bacterium]|nr:hypothetical protein [Bacteroidales bacterium]